jgi:hypothetical protein
MSTVANTVTRPRSEEEESQLSVSAFESGKGYASSCECHGTEIKVAEVLLQFGVHDVHLYSDATNEVERLRSVSLA